MNHIDQSPTRNEYNPQPATHAGAHAWLAWIDTCPDWRPALDYVLENEPDAVGDICAWASGVFHADRRLDEIHAAEVFRRAHPELFPVLPLSFDGDGDPF